MSERSEPDLEFFLDPVCPWCWITSRWVTNVQRDCEYDVQWRFISLELVNRARQDDDRSPQHQAGHQAGLRALRVADQIRLDHGNEAVAAYYTALGNRIHVARRRDELLDESNPLIVEALAEAGLDAALIDHAKDDTHDEHLQAEVDLALSRTGPNVGTPILTFAPGQGEREGSFFGPVISKAPRGDDAVKLWRAVETLATSGVAELKRSLRAKPEFD